MNCDSHVGRQCPGRGCPDEQRCGVPDDGEPDHDRGVGLVPVLDLGLCEGGLAPGAPGDDPARVPEEALLVCPLEGPPCGLDVIQFDCLIGVVPIHPYSELLELLRHILTKSDSELLTGVDELVYSQLLDVLLRVDTDVLLDLDLDGESVHIESGLIADVVSVHAPVSYQDILDGLVHRGSEVDRTCSVWWSVDEVEFLAVLPGFPGLLISVLGLPVLLDAFLDALCIIIGADWRYHC